MESLKEFVGVYFNKVQWEIVPRSWLHRATNGDLKCFWPPLKGEELQIAAILSKEPDESTWSVHPVHKVAETSSDYNRTIRKMIQEEETETENESSQVFSAKKKKVSSAAQGSQRATLTIHQSQLSTPHKIPLCSAVSPRQSPRLKAKFKLSSSKNLFSPPPRDNGSSSDEDMFLATGSTTAHVVDSEEFIPASNSDERQNVKKQLMFIQKSVQEIEKKQAKMYSDFSVKLDALTKAVEELQGKRVQTSEQVDRLRPPPARNPQELEAMVRHESFMAMLGEKSDTSLSKTLTGMVKAIMTRDCALLYSVTGLGVKRQNTKLSFKETSACSQMLQAVRRIPEYSNVTGTMFLTAIGHVLKNSVDWDGHRGKRKRDLADRVRQQHVDQEGSVQQQEHPEVQQAEQLLDTLKNNTEGGCSNEDTTCSLLRSYQLLNL